MLQLVLHCSSPPEDALDTPATAVVDKESCADLTESRLRVASARRLGKVEEEGAALLALSEVLLSRDLKAEALTVAQDAKGLFNSASDKQAAATRSVVKVLLAEEKFEAASELLSRSSKEHQHSEVGKAIMLLARADVFVSTALVREALEAWQTLSLRCCWSCVDVRLFLFLWGMQWVLWLLVPHIPE